LLPSLSISRNVVPPSANIISAPSASKVISPATSIVKSPLDRSISVPSIVMLSTVSPPSSVKAVALGILAAVIELSAISATTTAPAPNKMGMAAGGAMSGASMGYMMGGPGGAMAGAAIGGLGGLLGGLL